MTAAFDDWAATYTAEPNPLRALSRRIVKPWLADVRPGHRVLDAGCGPAPALPQAIGLDLSREMLRQGPRGRVVQADLSAGPFPPQSFDWVFAFLALSYAVDPGAALVRLTELVQPGGRLIVCDLHPEAAAWRRGPGLESRPRDLAVALTPPPDWTEVERVEAGFGEPERPIFEAAGRLDLWARTTGTLAVLAAHWRR